MIEQIAKYLMENWRELVWPAVLFAAVVVAGWVLRHILYCPTSATDHIHRNDAC